MPNFPSDYIQKAFLYQVNHNHRTLFAFIGPDTKKSVPSLHKKLCFVNNLQSIIWCHKNPDSAIDNLNKKQKLCDNDDDLTKWIKINSPEFVSYNEITKILGKTCEMIIIQNFEAVSPNILAICLETVKGGGAIIFLFDSENSLVNIINKKNDLSNVYGANKGYSQRYNTRLFKLLFEIPCTIFLDNKMRVMNISKAIYCDQSFEKVKVNSNNILKNYCSLDVCKTEDQRNVLINCTERLKSGSAFKISIIASRGRGKSAVLGLIISDALNKGLNNIQVSALFLENIQIVFEYIILGLSCYGYKKSVDFKVIYTFSGKNRFISKIEITKNNRQIVEYIHPFEKLRVHPNLLIIDEAASIPLMNLKQLLIVDNVIMASTANGYEGTGRVFRSKLSDYIKEKSYQHWIYELKEPIRYSEGDEVEHWLNKSLLLENNLAKISDYPSPENCVLYHINKDVLFSGTNETEKFLANVFSLFVSSHYRNSPDDLQILADSPSHEIFVLMAPNSKSLVICAIQIAFEGFCDKNSYNKVGDAIPWIIKETYNCDKLLNALGARIVRIAVHPSLQSMGYGSKALNHISDILLKSKKIDGKFIRCEKEDILLNQVSKVFVPEISWLGVCFGLNEKLLNFWKKNGFCPTGIKQTKSKTTGEFSCCVLKSVRCDSYDYLISYSKKFYYRLITQIGYSYKDFSPSLCLSLLHNNEFKYNDNEFPKCFFLEDDIDNMRMYISGSTTLRNVLHSMPLIARLYYFEKTHAEQLSVLHQSVLIMIGLQYKSILKVEEELGLENFQIDSILSNIIEWVLKKKH